VQGRLASTPGGLIRFLDRPALRSPPAKPLPAAFLESRTERVAGTRPSIQTAGAWPSSNTLHAGDLLVQARVAGLVLPFPPHCRNLRLWFRWHLILSYSRDRVARFLPRPSSLLVGATGPTLVPVGFFLYRSPPFALPSFSRPRLSTSINAEPVRPPQRCQWGAMKEHRP
jgi:hypothetical protein